MSNHLYNRQGAVPPREGVRAINLGAVQQTHGPNGRGRQGRQDHPGRKWWFSSISAKVDGRVAPACWRRRSFNCGRRRGCSSTRKLQGEMAAYINARAEWSRQTRAWRTSRARREKARSGIPGTDPRPGWRAGNARRGAAARAKRHSLRGDSRSSGLSILEAHCPQKRRKRKAAAPARTAPARRTRRALSISQHSGGKQYDARRCQ